ncbi:MAG: glycosyltransferase [Clostridia bacterium]|nr:glycosyltransferase [Clostridia bacterium]
MKTEKISIIITTFNRPLNILSRAVESVKKQTYQNKQIIIINSAPENKELKQKINKYAIDNKVEYYETEKKSNACIARNLGISKAKGEYIAFLDDDDEWIEEKLEKQIDKFDSEIVGMVYCDFYIINKNKIKKVQYSKKEGNVLGDLLKKNMIGGCSIPLISKKAIDDCGNFDMNFKSSQDYDMWIRICKKYQVRHIGQPLVKYYISPDAITRSIQKRIDGWENLINKHEELYLNNKKSSNYFFNVIASELIKFGEFDKGIYYYKKAIKDKKISINNLMIIKGILKYALYSIRCKK